MVKHTTTARTANLADLLSDLGHIKELEKYLVTAKSAVFRITGKGKAVYLGDITALGSLVRSREMTLPVISFSATEGRPGVFDYREV